MTTRSRPAFTLYELLVALGSSGLLISVFLPFLARARNEAVQTQKLQNLKSLGLACHNYHDTIGRFPPGNDGDNFSAAAHLLPYLEQANLYKQIDFKKPMTDQANATVRATIVQSFLSPRDPQKAVTDAYGATNYLFCAGSKPALADNDGVFYQDSKVSFPQILDGTSNTLMMGETLKGDKNAKPGDARRLHVRLDKDALGKLQEDSGVQDFKDNKNIAHDGCASWMDGRFLQGTFTATRLPNEEKPDVDCGGMGGLSALRSLDDLTAFLMCDGSARIVKTNKIKADLWKALATRAGGEVVKPDF
jgi:type II secretory pathway pseudopilin PulG